ncbi:MAG: D-alanyl-D-alanine carboxypeptidase family protein [Verrucomicrobia bacterium]|nr:D-alanyl-D-alanine carboxypeptidase family protein [Verrucomicrobiota bacterium]
MQPLSEIHRALRIPTDYAAARGLVRQPEARRLVLIGRAADDGRPVRVAPSAAKAWRQMYVAAAKNGIALLPLSGFRSVARQTKIIRDKLSAGEAIGEILRLIAAPGYSEHHTGRAIDIGTPDHLLLDAQFATTPAYHWLRRHAGGFGFHLSYPPGNPQGFDPEPWHWCFRPGRPTTTGGRAPRWRR